MPSSLAVSATELPPASFASASRSMRTICSEVCLFFIESPRSTHLGCSDSHSSWINFRGADQVGGSAPLTLRFVCSLHLTTKSGLPTSPSLLGFRPAILLASTKVLQIGGFWLSNTLSRLESIRIVALEED